MTLGGLARLEVVGDHGLQFPHRFNVRIPFLGIKVPK